MKPVFIFADHVTKALESGEKEIEIPQGARISAAAYDIIRDNKIRITYVATKTLAADTAINEAEIKPTGEEESQSIQDKSDSEKSKSETPRNDGAELSEAVLSDIVERVIERFYESARLSSNLLSIQLSGHTVLIVLCRKIRDN